MRGLSLIPLRRHRSSVSETDRANDSIGFVSDLMNSVASVQEKEHGRESGIREVLPT